MYPLWVTIDSFVTAYGGFVVNSGLNFFQYTLSLTWIWCVFNISLALLFIRAANSHSFSVRLKQLTQFSRSHATVNLVGQMA